MSQLLIDSFQVISGGLDLDKDIQIKDVDNIISPRFRKSKAVKFLPAVIAYQVVEV